MMVTVRRNIVFIFILCNFLNNDVLFLYRSRNQSVSPLVERERARGAEDENLYECRFIFPTSPHVHNVLECCRSNLLYL